MKKIYIIKGRKWWDKINGNTYNSVKLFDAENEKTYFFDFAYGYGGDYFDRAYKKIEELNGGKIDFDKIYIYNAGAEYDLKTNVKKFNY